jgi:TfoX/Sxy family transcriptional regulator of competence genes
MNEYHRKQVDTIPVENRNRPVGHDPKVLQAICLEAAPPDLELAFKPMFGGIMGYAEGKAFASLSDVGLALKLAGADHKALLAMPGSEPLRYAPDQPPSKSYVVAPEAMLSDRNLLRTWIVRCVESLPLKSPAARKRLRRPSNSIR